MALLEVRRIKDGRAILGVVGESQVFLPFQVHLLACIAATEPDAQGDRYQRGWEPESQHRWSISSVYHGGEGGRGEMGFLSTGKIHKTSPSLM